MASLPAPLPSSRREPDPEPQVVAPERLAECVRGLDPGTRALLDLSVRRRLRDDAMAPLLRTDAFHLAWRRARALERVASDLGGDAPVSLAKVRAALETLPREAWDPLSVPALPRPAEPVVAAEPVLEAESVPAEEPPDAQEVPATGAELVPAPSTALDAPPERLSHRLDAFAAA